MKIALPLVLLCFAVPAWAQLHGSYVPSPADIRQGYLETLYEKLLQEVKDDNFGVAKLVAAEIDRVSGMKFTSYNIAPCGTWKWVGSTMTTLYPGGKVIGNAGNATWSWIDEKQRKFQIKWETGWLDKCTLSEDLLSLKCKNNAGAEFTFSRALPEVEPDAAAKPGAANNP
jgi:hypothetical protein